MFETLAAEAIVAHDRAKALRAVLASPLVNSYDQAERILKLVFDATE
jgi:alpha-galactosidase/6-phospho-beta-glucosidase family protein